MTSYRPALTLVLAGLLLAAERGSLGAAPAADAVQDAVQDAAQDAALAAADVVEVDLTWLTTLEWEPGRELPEAVRALDGRTAVVRGYMHASVQTDVKVFPMVSEACQCAGRLMVHHFVQIDLGEAETGPRAGQFEVIGRLSIGERWEDGFCTSVFRLRGRFY